jgi:uncharacterized repeat protein (TIGR03803 family)
MTVSRMLVALTLCAAPAIPSHAQTFTSLASRDGSNGSDPYLMSLVQGTDGMFYHPGGWRLRLGHGIQSEYKRRHSALTLGTDGNFYGVTEYGGGAKDLGTVFKAATASSTGQGMGAGPMAMERCSRSHPAAS